ncbi:MAG: hypothetical protein WCF18_18550 [Chthoniobacteraceae bacterium]
MAGSLRILVFPLAFGALAAAAFGQTSPDAPQSTPPGKKAPAAWLNNLRKGALDGTPSPEFENVRRALDALTPEQRKRFQENIVRWSNLPPDEKKALRDREEARKKIMQQEIDAAIQGTGLQLDSERRVLFVKRYGEERRKIEEQLRKETNEKRKPLVHEMVGRLKAEFSAPVVAPEAVR